MFGIFNRKIDVVFHDVPSSAKLGVLVVDKELSPSVASEISKEWERVKPKWLDYKIILLGRGCELQSLTDEQLRELGLCRIKK